ncbi:Vesicle-mediated ER to Golgi transport protein, partial [Nowakowskiella sp. JEL0078]
MDFIYGSYQALKGDKGTSQSVTATVDKLCDRIQTATLLEDRRASVLSLKSLARDEHSEVGNKGIPILIHVLKKDRMDVDIVNAAIETLTILCSCEDVPKNAKQSSTIPALGFGYLHWFAKDPKNVTLLLDMLEEVDFYVRFNTIQLLSVLLENMTVPLQEAVLTSPLGVSRLMDLLDDRREMIRN